MIREEKDKGKYLQQLGNRIKSLRIQLGYSSYENFAFDNDIPRAQYGRYEAGEDLRFSSLVKVVHALGMSLSEFFAEGFEDINSNSTVE